LSRFLALFLASCLAGCAAAITNSGPDEIDPLQGGATEAQLSHDLGAPVRSVALAAPRQAIALWEADHAVSLLLPQQVAVSQSLYKFKGHRDGKQGRVAQAGFDSFMTLGLAEVFLVPKAMLERGASEDLFLAAWFAADGRVVAYQWLELPR
jgi:hypothetical protein